MALYHTNPRVDIQRAHPNAIDTLSGYRGEHVARWVEGQVINTQRWTDQLYSLRFDAPVEPFSAGQFTKVALDIESDRVGRPYSYVNAPSERPLEIYFIRVPNGPLTNRLIELQAGDKLWVSPQPSGFFTLSEVPAAEHLWMLSTGTALGVFLSILKTDEPWQRFEKIVLVHAVRKAEELNYAAIIERLQREHPEQFSFIPFVSREQVDFALCGRIPAMIENGRLEERAGLSINADQSQFMLCGNPGMVKDTTEVLLSRGLQRNRRREPGQITTEKYW